MMLVDGLLKITDLDSLTSTVKRCGPDKRCSYKIPCTNGLCIGENAARNMVRATRSYLKNLLNCHNCAQGSELYTARALLHDMGKGTINAREASVRLKAIQATFVA